MILEPNVDPIAVVEKEKQYRAYIDKHIANVQKAFDLYGHMIMEKLNELDPSQADLLECTFETRRGDHDQSKYSPEEFGGYRARYYPVSQEESDAAIDASDAAWLHHLHVNDHHPEYWVMPDDGDDGPIIMDMSHGAILEMLMDWQAMSTSPGSSPYKYWQDNKKYKERVMSQATYQKVDYLVTFLKDSLPQD